MLGAPLLQRVGRIAANQQPRHQAGQQEGQGIAPAAARARVRHARTRLRQISQCRIVQQRSLLRFAEGTKCGEHVGQRGRIHRSAPPSGNRHLRRDRSYQKSGVISSPRIHKPWVDGPSRGRRDLAPLRRALSPRPCQALVAPGGLEPPASHGDRARRGGPCAEAAHAQWYAERWPALPTQRPTTGRPASG